MHRYYLSSAAHEDMLAIWEFVAVDSLTAADRIIDRFTAAFDRIAAMPESGTSYEHPKGTFRFVIVTPYLIFYKFAGDDVSIVRVLHGARRWEDVL